MSFATAENLKTATKLLKRHSYVNETQQLKNNDNLYLFPQTNIGRQKIKQKQQYRVGLGKLP